MSPRIVYLSWSASEISGGIKMVYLHVDRLRAAGFDAVVATEDGSRPEWFSAAAPTITFEAVAAGDALVFPENYNRLLERFRESPQPKVVFCQNPYYAHRGLREARCYSELGVDEIIVPGRGVYDFCTRRFPSLRVSLVPVTVDTNVFKVQSEKRLQIAYSPRKRPLEAAIIQDLFWSLHPEFQSIPWVPIADQTEATVARILSESALFLSLCRLEGCPLSILEAFASGCLVAGFLGWGGRDYANACNGYWAEEDNCMDCAEQLGRAVTTVTSNSSLYTEIVSLAHSDARRYGLKRFEDRLLGFWNAYLGRHFR